MRRSYFSQPKLEHEVGTYKVQVITGLCPSLRISVLFTTRLRNEFLVPECNVSLTERPSSALMRAVV